MDTREYKIGGSWDPHDLYSSDFFGKVAEYLTSMPDTTGTEEEEVQADKEDSVEDSSSYTDEEYDSLLERYNDLSTEYENLKRGISSGENQDFGFLDFLFSDFGQSKSPLLFSDDELYPSAYGSYSTQPANPTPSKTSNLYEASLPYQGMKYGFGSAGKNNRIDCSGYVCRVLDVPRTTSEAIMTGSTNFRRYSGEEELPEGTVVGFDMGPRGYDKHRDIGIDHVGIVIRDPNTGELQLSESVSGKGVINRPLKEALLDYKKRSKSMYLGEYKVGGKVARSEEELYHGLNDNRYNEMMLDLPPQYNLIRGLDNGMPIYVADQLGNSEVLRGSDDVANMYGKVYEKKIV